MSCWQIEIHAASQLFSLAFYLGYSLHSICFCHEAVPLNQIQHRTWFVELGLALSAAPAEFSECERPPALQPSYAEIRIWIREIIDESNTERRRITSLQHVSFAYKPTRLADTSPDGPDLACQPANLVDVVGFAHCLESILDTIVHSWIRDPRVVDQRWTPV